jgi:3-demethoxyubiquinol 3-hydroxylase
LFVDRLLITLDQALRTVAGASHAARPRPSVAQVDGAPLSDAERRLSGALMRVNHVGEVCAQALYIAQSLTARDAALQRHYEAAAREEVDHLAWTEARLVELGARKSLLNPFWYGGSFAIGLLAGRAGEALSLGFVLETERQVEQHLQSHLDQLPLRDAESRAIVDQMKSDEARHAQQAQDAGAAALPAPVRFAMRIVARLMTRTAHHI